MRKIPPSIREQINKDPFFKECCLCHTEKGKIEIHHNFIYAGKQADALFTLLPLCVEHHNLADYTKVKEKLDWIMIGRMVWSDFSVYPRYNWKQREEYLDEIFGVYPQLKLMPKQETSV